MKRKKFLRGAAALGVSGTVVKALGALYKIPLVSLIGCLGLGLYQSAYAFYAFVATLCSAGIASCLSKVVAEKRATGRDPSFAVSSYMRVFIALGVLGAFCVVAFPMIFKKRAAGTGFYAYAFLALSLPLVCVDGVLCGNFQGRGEMIPTAASEVAGQTAKMLVGLSFCFIFRKSAGLTATLLCLAATLSVGVETLVLCLFLKGGSKRKKGGALGDGASVKIFPRLQNGRGIGGGKRLFLFDKSEFRRVLGYTYPVALCATALPLTAFVESMLLPDLLGVYESAPLAIYGLFAGGATCLSHVPATLSRGVAATIVPDLSASVREGGAIKAKRKIAYALFLTAAIVLPVCVALALFAPLAVKILFPSLDSFEKSLLISCVRISCGGTLFFALTQTLTACMTALNLQRVAAACWGVACLSRVFFDLLFVGFFKFSAIGASIAEAGCYFVAFFLVSAYNISVFRAEARGAPA